MGSQLDEISVAIGTLTAEVQGLRRDVGQDRQESAAYRQGVREEIAKLVLRMTHVETQTGTLSVQVGDMQKITDDVVELRQQAAGAGTLGRWLIRIGIGVVTAAGWVVGIYTWLTGRPPP